MKICNGSSSNFSSHNNGNAKNSGKNKTAKSSVGNKRKGSMGRDDTCGHYGKNVHWACECRKKKHDKEAQTHLAQGEEDEQSLLMAHATITDFNSTPMTPSQHRVRIEEQKVFADLEPSEERDD
jgi:hypothetical protein